MSRPASAVLLQRRKLTAQSTDLVESGGGFAEKGGDAEE